VLTSQLNTWLGKTLLIDVAVATFSANLAIQESASPGGQTQSSEPRQHEG